MSLSVPEDFLGHSCRPSSGLIKTVRLSGVSGSSNSYGSGAEDVNVDVSIKNTFSFFSWVSPDVISVKSEGDVAVMITGREVDAADLLRQ